MAHVKLPEEELEPLKKTLKEELRVKFDKEEDIKPLVIAFRKIFEPIAKSLKSIEKIPEEIKRVTEKISKDMDSGMPERTVNAVEKIAENPEIVGSPVTDDLADPMEKLNAQLQVLIDNGIPAKIDDDNKLVKLTEKEIIEKQKTFIENRKQEKVIKEQIETIKKSDMTAEDSAKELTLLNEELQQNTIETDELQNTLGERFTPREKMGGDEKPEGPRLLSEMTEAGMSVFGAPVQAFDELKNSFMDNFGNLLKLNMFQIKMNQDHYNKMENFSKTGEKADKISVAKFTILAATAALILGKLVNFFDNEDDPLDEYRRLTTGGERPTQETFEDVRERVKKNNPNMSYEEIDTQILIANPSITRNQKETTIAKGQASARDSFSSLYGITGISDEVFDSMVGDKIQKPFIPPENFGEQFRTRDRGDRTRASYTNYFDNRSSTSETKVETGVSNGNSNNVDAVEVR